MKLKLAALLASTATNMIQVGQVASRVSVYEGCMMVGRRREGRGVAGHMRRIYVRGVESNKR